MASMQSALVEQWSSAFRHVTSMIGNPPVSGQLDLNTIEDEIRNLIALQQGFEFVAETERNVMVRQGLELGRTLAGILETAVLPRGHSVRTLADDFIEEAENLKLAWDPEIVERAAKARREVASGECISLEAVRSR